MKTMKQLFTSLLFIAIGMFFITNTQAQNNAKQNPTPDICYPYVPVGNNVTLSGTPCAHATLGATTTCNGSGWVSGSCSGPCLSCPSPAGNCGTLTYSWAPSTYLSCTTCANPVATTPCDA